MMEFHHIHILWENIYKYTYENKGKEIKKENEHWCIYKHWFLILIFVDQLAVIQIYISSELDWCKMMDSTYQDIQSTLILNKRNSLMFEFRIEHTNASLVSVTSRCLFLCISSNWKSITTVQYHPRILFFTILIIYQM